MLCLPFTTALRGLGGGLRPIHIIHMYDMYVYVCVYIYNIYAGCLSGDAMRCKPSSEHAARAAMLAGVRTANPEIKEGLSLIHI